MDLSKIIDIDSSLECLQPGEARAGRDPLILIHDGSGVSWKYRRIMPLDRELWGMSSPYFFTEETWDGLSSMAGAYAAKASVTVAGPSVLGGKLSQLACHLLSSSFRNLQLTASPGWSFGGVVAFRAAQLLLAKDYPVKGVILIDSPAPLDQQPLPTEIVNAIVKPPDKDADEMSIAINKAVLRQFTLNTALLVKFEPAPMPTQPKMILLRSREGFDASGLACERHAWLEDREDRRSAVQGWETVVGAKVEVIDIPGNHFEVFEDDNVSLNLGLLDDGRFNFQDPWLTLHTRTGPRGLGCNQRSLCDVGGASNGLKRNQKEVTLAVLNIQIDRLRRHDAIHVEVNRTQQQLPIHVSL